ncbi:MAG: ribosome-binding factor A [Candidatus Moranbacteria bacterium]|nr:ribosome-binding factor A [Candidatus Moranbacteria bacterium]
MAGLRLEKINELLQHKISALLTKGVSFKLGVFVTVARVSTSPDLRRSKVLVSVFPASEGQYVLKTLKKEVYAFQGALNNQLHMNPLPRIHFELDTTEEEAQKVEDILRDLR